MAPVTPLTSEQAEPAVLNNAIIFRIGATDSRMGLKLGIFWGVYWRHGVLVVG